ncbi:MAG TPA: PIN domain-containing protein [Kofleriaceae bacterium]|nr:PIN domain-containing protein [Kofleriaceae bacterium]
MSVIVDTTIWSQALRRRDRVTNHPVVVELTKLVQEGRVTMMGAIRQELLSGLKSEAQFVRLRDALRPFDDVQLEPDDYEEGARCFNRCMQRGVQGSNTDFLLCAVALRRDLSVFTSDRDFLRYAAVLGVRLHAAA